MAGFLWLLGWFVLPILAYAMLKKRYPARIRAWLRSLRDPLVLVCILVAAVAAPGLASAPCVTMTYTLVPTGDGHSAAFTGHAVITGTGHIDACTGYSQNSSQVLGSVGGGDRTPSHSAYPLDGYYFPGSTSGIDISAPDVQYHTSWNFQFTVFLEAPSCGAPRQMLHCAYQVNCPATGPASFQQTGVTVVWAGNLYDDGQPPVTVIGSAMEDATDACGTHGSGQDVDSTFAEIGHAPGSGTGSDEVPDVDGYTPLAKRQYDAGTFAPNAGNPGDLSIGIPGIGSISIPIGWVYDMAQYVMQLYSLYTGLSKMSLANAGKEVLKAMGLDARQIGNTFADLYKQLLTPAPSKQFALSQKWTLFVDWGPHHWTNSLNLALTPQGFNASATATGPHFSPMSHLYSNPDVISQPGQVAHIVTRDQTPGSLGNVAGATPGMQSHALRPHDGSTDDPAPTTDIGEITTGQIGIPVMSVPAADGYTEDQFGTRTAVRAGQWYDTGERVPLDFSAFQNAPVWPVFRQMLGALVYITFAIITAMKMWPRQEF